MTEDDLLSAIAEEINSMPVVQPGDITLAELEKRTKRDRYFLTRYMQRRVDAGEFEKIDQAYSPGTRKLVTVYRPIKR